MEQLYLPKNHYFCTKLKKISSQWNNFQKLFLSLYRHLEKEVATSRRAIKLGPVRESGKFNVVWVEV